MTAEIAPSLLCIFDFCVFRALFLDSLASGQWFSTWNKFLAHGLHFWNSCLRHCYQLITLRLTFNFARSYFQLIACAYLAPRLEYCAIFKSPTCCKTNFWLLVCRLKKKYCSKSILLKKLISDPGQYLWFFRTKKSNQIFHYIRCNTPKRVPKLRGRYPRHCTRATQLLLKKYRCGDEQLAALSPIWPARDLNLIPLANSDTNRYRSTSWLVIATAILM